MKLDEEQINKSFLCVLKKNESSVSFDTIPITETYAEEYSEILSMISLARSAGKYTSSTILDKIKKSNDLNKTFTVEYSHCYNFSLSAPYQDHKSIEQVDYKVGNFSKELDPVEIEKMKLDKLFELTEYYQKAHQIDVANKKVESDKNIIAYSHRRIGWKGIEYKFDKNFQFHCHTNFGYGSSSYFHLILVYKNIQVVPYSDWIIYRYADAYSIMRYTRKYYTLDKEWYSAFMFAEQSINHYLANKKGFVEQYIIQEVEKMVEGLEKILTDSRFQLLGVYDSLQSFDYYARELIDFRGEKISGATAFIKSLLTLDEIISVDKYVNRIVQCTVTIKPIVERELEQVNIELIDIEPKIQKLERKMNGANNKFKKAQVLNDDIKSLFDNLRKKSSFTFINDVQAALLTYTIFEKEYIGLRDKSTKLNNEYYKMVEVKNLLIKYQEKFTKYIDIIDGYFNAK